MVWCGIVYGAVGCIYSWTGGLRPGEVGSVTECGKAISQGALHVLSDFFSVITRYKLQAAQHAAKDLALECTVLLHIA